MEVNGSVTGFWGTRGRGFKSRHSERLFGEASSQDGAFFVLRIEDSSVEESGMETTSDRLRALIQRVPELSEAEKLRQAIEMVDAGVEMMRLNLRRQFPDESEDSIEERLRAWLRDRPGAPHGDGLGVPSCRRFDV